MPSDKKGKSLKKRYSSFFSNRKDILELELEPGNSLEGSYSSLNKFKSSREEVDPVLRNMDENMLQKINNDKVWSDQQVQEMEESLGLLMQAIRDIDAKIQVMSINQPMVEVVLRSLQLINKGPYM